jgi:predicted histidine transporter YuiF (NhaC family)
MVILEFLSKGVIIPALTACAGICLGFAVRYRQTRKLQKRTAELEEEMLYNHREILELEKQLAQRLAASLKDTPVFSIPAARANQKTGL